MKRIILTNGCGGAGKDTFIHCLQDFLPLYKYSSIDGVKRIAAAAGWQGGKTDRDRAFLHELKCLTAAYNNFPFKDTTAVVEDFNSGRLPGEYLFIDVREPANLAHMARAYHAFTLLIINNRLPAADNPADRNVAQYEYDFYVRNNAGLDALYNRARIFSSVIRNPRIKPGPGLSLLL